MATNAKKTKEQLAPLRPSQCDFGADQHKINRFSVIVPGRLKKADLEDPRLWVNQARNLTIGCEVRCIADDMSFMAYCFCTHVNGSTAKFKVTNFTKLDKVDYDAMGDPANDYEVRLRGPSKWCIVQKSTGDVIKSDISDQLSAMRELVDYQKALRS